jgi:hypothetical protein
MKITLSNLVEMVKNTPYLSNQQLIAETMVEVIKKNNPDFTKQKEKNFLKKCGVIS